MVFLYLIVLFDSLLNSDISLYESLQVICYLILQMVIFL